MPTRIVLRDSERQSRYASSSSASPRRPITDGAGNRNEFTFAHNGDGADEGAGKVTTESKQGASAAPRSPGRFGGALIPTTPTAAAGGIGLSAAFVPRPRAHNHHGALSPRQASTRKVVTLRPSIVRKLPPANGESGNGGDRNADADGRSPTSAIQQVAPQPPGGRDDLRASIHRYQQYEQRQRLHQTSGPHLSKKDIRASPQLAGYWFQLLACTVMLISVVQFYRDQETDSILDLFKELREGESGDTDAGSALNATNATNAALIDAIMAENSSSAPPSDPLENQTELLQGGGDNGVSIGESDADDSDAGIVYDTDKYFTSVNGPVLRWKLIGCIVVATVGAVVSFIILVLHYDTIILPRAWFYLFRGGSRFEQALLFLLGLFWCGAVYINTSTLSVGEVQANVFFTTWIGFVAATANYGTWRISANKPSFAEFVIFHHRETTYNWVWLLMFSFAFALASSDIYFNREELEIQYRGRQEVDLTRREWFYVLCAFWSFPVICIMALFFNHYIKTTSIIACCNFGWRHIEGLLLFGMMGAYFWIIFAHTGVSGVINGVQNAYFAVWGSFFNTVFTFGTWLRENRDIVESLQ
mmetsp:Transcript_20298/g.57647  ORF Transcript_20298/g.57647 Transcript_20298/m.57647 type:complete len:589 (-) Transcript_20298:456-2222(-)